MELTRLAEISWRKFLDTSHGQEAMLWLRHNTPKVSRGDSHQMMFDSGVSDGWNRVLDEISDINPRRQNPETDLENPGLSRVTT